VNSKGFFKVEQYKLSGIYKFLNKTFPQNYIIRQPYFGTMLFLASCFCFVVLYKPLNLHHAPLFNFESTMAIYLGALVIPVVVIIMILKNFRNFSNPNEWTILKEVFSIALILFGMGIGIYFLGFLMESPGKRWNLPTFLDSCKQTFLIGIVPFGFFVLLNYRHLITPDIEKAFKPEPDTTSDENPEKLVRIGSQLKKEELNIYPSQFIYAESDSNYVVFYLNIDNHVQKKIIRNSISNIEQQLSTIPFVMRTHRAFIVNVLQVVSEKGNTLGYRLKLNGIDSSIPVSRQKARDFDQLLKQYR
jgi:hypothetical protein